MSDNAFVIIWAGQFVFMCIFADITTILELTSKPDWNLLGVIELRAEEFVQRCVEDIVELEEGLNNELEVELDNAAVVLWI